jgi:hypothetical protein
MCRESAIEYAGQLVNVEQSRAVVDEGNSAGALDRRIRIA